MDATTQQASLRESEARFRAALNAGRLGTWETDHSTRTRVWSEEGMRLFGLDLPAGRGTVDGPNDEYVAAIHPDDRHLVAHFRALAERLDSFPAEYRIVRPDGTTLWLAGRGAVVARFPDGRPMRLVSIMGDDTERRQAEEHLRLERERLGLALSVGRMGAYDFNLRDGVLWWSPQMYAVFGVDPASFVPTPESVTALLHPDDRQTFHRQRDEALAERRVLEIEMRAVRPDGTLLWVAHRGQADYDGDGRPVRSFGISMDITERRRIEDILRDADQQKDRFLAVLAHELRNPLAPIRSAVELLRRPGLGGDKAAWCHDIIDRQVRQMSHLLDDLLDLSRLSRGQLRLQLRTLDVAHVLERALETAEPWITAAGHALAVTVPSDTFRVEGDLARLTQVFSNVLINAAKYTPAHGRIDVSAEARDGWLALRIADNGIGISAEHLPLVFALFAQVESSVGRADAGQGVGLSLAKSLLDLHGGTIDAFSDGVGTGSLFEIRLPLAASPPSAAPATGEASLSPVRSRRVLFVDDQRDIADSYALLFRERGHVAEAAYDGGGALDVAESFQPEFCVVDLGMPGVDGLELGRRIRAAPWGATVTLIAHSGWGQDDDRRRSSDAGFDHHVLKPAEPEALFRLIEGPSYFV